MKVQGRALFREVVAGKDGSKYVSAVDLQTGGDLKFRFSGPSAALAVGLLNPDGSPAEHAFEGTVKGRLYNLAVTLDVQDWRLTPAAK